MIEMEDGSGRNREPGLIRDNQVHSNFGRALGSPVVVAIGADIGR